jgi:3D (Asp-Asp-Asp) domain-containing protein
VDADHPWGVGVQNRALVPYRSVAVDSDVIAYGTALYVVEFDGVHMPGDAPWGDFVHDGCVSADDTGGSIIGMHIDFFAALRTSYYDLDARLGLNDVTLHEGGDRCAQ